MEGEPAGLVRRGARLPPPSAAAGSSAAPSQPAAHIKSLSCVQGPSYGSTDNIAACLPNGMPLSHITGVVCMANLLVLPL